MSTLVHTAPTTTRAARNGTLILGGGFGGAYVARRLRAPPS